jgi:hypothetical protein
LVTLEAIVVAELFAVVLVFGVAAQQGAYASGVSRFPNKLNVLLTVRFVSCAVDTLRVALDSGKGEQYCADTTEKVTLPADTIVMASVAAPAAVGFVGAGAGVGASVGSEVGCGAGDGVGAGVGAAVGGVKAAFVVADGAGVGAGVGAVVGGAGVGGAADINSQVRESGVGVPHDLP